MRFTFRRASDWQTGGKPEQMEIDSLDELIELLNAEKCDLIISRTESGHLEIKSYDDYLE